MAVFRIEKTRDYTVMSNHHLRDTDLSLKSKGLLSMMLSLPEDWNYTTRGLAKICKEGTDSISFFWIFVRADCIALLIFEMTPSNRAAAYSRSFCGAFRSGERTQFLVSSTNRRSSLWVSCRTVSVTTSTALS